jgi:ketosteroid isomerase-like protein
MVRGFTAQMEDFRMTDGQGDSQDQAAIRQLIDSWTAAVRRRDLDAILRGHASDIVMFDVPPPFQSRGIEAYAKTWNTFFSWSNAPIAFDITAMDITAGADVAFAVCTMRCAGPGSDGKPEPLDFRLTVGLRKIGGQWTITHEHHSIPAVD